MGKPTSLFLFLKKYESDNPFIMETSVLSKFYFDDAELTETQKLTLELYNEELILYSKKEKKKRKAWAIMAVFLAGWLSMTIYFQYSLKITLVLVLSLYSYIF